MAAQEDSFSLRELQHVRESQSGFGQMVDGKGCQPVFSFVVAAVHVTQSSFLMSGYAGLKQGFSRIAIR